MLKRCFFALFLLALLGLAACSGREDPHVTKIGICIHDGKDAFESEFAHTLAARLGEKGYAVALEDAKKNQSAQNGHVQKWIAEGYDALILSPVITAAADELVTQLRTARLPAVFTCREPDGGVLSEWDRVCYVGCDESQPGTLLAQQVLALPAHGDINGDGVVSCLLIQDSPERLDTQQRTQALVEAFDTSGIAMELLDTVYAGEDRERCAAFCGGRLAKFAQKIEVVLCGSDALILGALEAIGAQERCVGEDIYLFGIGGTEEVRKALETGRLSGTVVRSVEDQTAITIHVLEQLLNGQSVESGYYVNYVTATVDDR